MSNSNNLKAFIRYDGSNRPIAGSVIYRLKKPLVGKWFEIQSKKTNIIETLIV